MKYFLTGATGFIGGRVARQLIAAGHEVVAIARDPAKATDLAALGIAVHRGDVTEKESMRTPMRGVDGVFHIAGWYKVGVKDARDGERINIAGTRNTLELMRDLGIPKGVYTSTLAIFSDTHRRLVNETYRYNGPHLSEYDRTKWVAHYEVADPLIAAGLPLVIVLPGVVYGPGDTSSVRTTFRQYLRRKLPAIPARTDFSWAHVDDIVHGHILAMEAGKSGENYIIAGPEHTLADALEIAEGITGIPAPRFHIPPAAMKGIAMMMGIVEKAVSVPPNYSAEYLRVGAGTTYIGDNTKARRELGYAPRPLEEGLRETLHHEMALLGLPIPQQA
ncbi:MAG: NAD-dependent epimerase/dehydratase family protein [Chloroflexota bacterium]|nr:NAD-dependent epimerase/dehydratase family protein [Chloroflexota bacterium]MDQ6907275.1 NAD-dependent epimerase/dehydratase family protein [Chloroflexota bacterium]